MEELDLGFPFWPLYNQKYKKQAEVETGAQAGNRYGRNASVSSKRDASAVIDRWEAFD